jgi:drug/metabolite transporter (DMT)-like permease
LGQVCFKQAANHAMPLAMTAEWLWRIFSKGWVYGAILGYIGAFFTWMTLLRRIPVGPAFAASHLEVVSVMLVSIWIFNDVPTWSHISGAILILAGIICLAFAEKEIHEKEIREKERQENEQATSTDSV